MKKSILTILVFFVCAIQSTTAYEYFTIYFSDGTKSEVFYATDVDSICYSKLSLDSIAYDDWQVQEIYTCDSVYRYPLAQIDSLSFRDVDVDELAQDFTIVCNTITPLFMKCSSPSELYEKLSIASPINGVENIWVDGHSLYVKIRDMEPISYYYPPELDSNINEEFLAQIQSLSRARANRTTTQDHNFVNAKKACVVNQMYYNEHVIRSACKTISNRLSTHFNEMGIKTDIINKPRPDFFYKDMFQYDMLFIMTHGEYDSKANKHWLCTGEELYCCDFNEPTIIDNENAKRILKIINEKKYKSLMNNLSIFCVAEERNGMLAYIIYTKVSEDFIKYAPNRFNNTIVYNTACESLMGNDTLGKIFYGKGASCYLGYNESNSVGRFGGYFFFMNLLNGKSTYSSWMSLPEKVKAQDLYKYVVYDKNGFERGSIKSDVYLWDGWYNNYYYKCKDTITSELKMIPENAVVCITQPETDLAKGLSSDEKMEMLLKGKMKKLITNVTNDAGNSYGFQYSTNSDMSQAKNKEVQGNYDSSTLYMNWEATLDEKDLQPNTSYYYRAYMNDDHSDCYGEIKQFTTGIPDNYEAYTVLANDTITFYYDDKCKKRQGIICNRTSNGEKHLYLYYNKGWLYHIKTAKFDPSFANYYATNMSGCFAYCTNMTEIIDIKYLKTDSVTDMREMFSDCRSLKNIDLSHFNTSKVKDMSRMFYVCWSLNSLDLSSFNTSNVTNMSLMFYECRALENLDLSSFNTTKVTNMYMMFEYCNSLTKLDLSSFNPINVTDMGYMFHECNSMTSLNLGNFNASNVKNMYAMFSSCNSLKDLVFSCFKTSKVTNMERMFWGCSSLISLDLSNFDTSNVTDMAAMFYGCSSLTSLDLSSFNTSKSSGYGSFFSDCSSLHKIYVSSNWKQSPGPSMFYDCIKLEGGKGTKIGENYYGYDDKGNPLYYNCGYDSSAAHIDGGKDWPGLFTAK